MDAVMETTLARWGNSQGLRIPKEVCDMLGVNVGSKAQLAVDASQSRVTLTFDQPARRYRRTRRASMEELCDGWSGGKVGREWGGPDVGAEAVR